MSTKCQSINAIYTFQYAKGGNPLSDNLQLANFSLNLGIGSSSSTLDLDFLYNGCGNFSKSAPLLPALGRAVSFTCNALSFGGIVNNATYTESASGFVYKVVITDPKRILENVTVMYQDYYCPINNIPNFINVLNEIESGVAVCPPGEDSENWPRVGSCALFGTSGYPNSSPNNGVQTIKVLQKLNGKTVYTTCNEALTVDISDLIILVNNRALWSRLTGSSSSMMQIFTQACDDVACDMFVELIGSTIKIWAIDRSIQPDLSVINSIIKTAKTTGNMVNGEEGMQEIYEESNRIILGDKVHYLAESTGVSMFMGYDADGNPQRVATDNFSVNLNTTPLIEMLGINISNNFAVTEAEIICSKTQQMWALYGCIEPNSLSRAILSALNIDAPSINTIFRAYTNLFNAANGAGIADADRISSFNLAKITLEQINSTISQRIRYDLYSLSYNWFRSWIDEHYGKKFLVPLNTFCAYPGNPTSIIKSDVGNYYLSDVPVEAGYPSQNQISNGIRNLQLGQDTTILETGDGKYSGFVEIDPTVAGTKNILGQSIQFKFAPQEMSPDSYIIKNNRLYLKIQFDGTIIVNNNTGKPEVLGTLSSKNISLPYFGDNLSFLGNRGLRAFAVLFGSNAANTIVGAGRNILGQQGAPGFNDRTSFNIFSVDSGAGGVNFAVVPMKSNVYVYGPWMASRGSSGSTKVEVKSDLNPWNYGGYPTMNTVGNALASNGLRISNIEASSSFTLAEPPGYSIAYFLRAGIYLDNINLTYDGTSGVTTKYSFKTFTAKFAEYGQAMASLAQEQARIRSSMLSEIREERRKRISQINNATAVAIRSLFPPEPGAENAFSPGFLLVGGYQNTITPNNDQGGGWGALTVPTKNKLSQEELCKYVPGTSQSPLDGTASIANQYEIGLNTKHGIEHSYTGSDFKFNSIMSLDGLLAPVSIGGRGGVLPQYGLYYNTGIDRVADAVNRLNKPRPSMPPVFKNDLPERLPINQTYLNPILSPTILNTWDGRGISEKTSSIIHVGFGTDAVDLYDDAKRNAADDFGFVALRGPLVLQAWGYDTENKPVPNIIDSPAKAEKGIFNAEGAKNKFMSNWLSNPKTWPVGPIDLRWDRDRGMWVCPPSDRIIVAQLIENLNAYGKAKAVLLNPSSEEGPFYENYRIYGPNGEIYSSIETLNIVVSDFLGRNLCCGTVIYAAFNDGKYIVLESSIVGEETTCDTCCELTTTTSTQLPTTIYTEMYTTTETVTETETVTVIETLTPTETFTETITETETYTTTETVTETETYTTTETVTETETITETSTETEPTTEQPTDDCACGLKACLEAAGITGAGVLGLDDNGCLTLYQFTECESQETVTETPTPTTGPSSFVGIECGTDTQYKLNIDPNAFIFTIDKVYYIGSTQESYANYVQITNGDTTGLPVLNIDSMLFGPWDTCEQASP